MLYETLLNCVSWVYFETYLKEKIKSLKKIIASHSRKTAHSTDESLDRDRDHKSQQ